MSDFSLDWPHGWQTKNGRAVEILKTNARGRYSVIGIIPEENNDRPGSWTPAGRYDEHAGPGCWDIINAPAPKPEPRKLWVNIYTCRDGTVYAGTFHSSREGADNSPTSFGCTRIACVCITEGDGLEGGQ